MIRFACLGGLPCSFRPCWASLRYRRMRRWLSQHVKGSVRPRRMAGRFARLERVPGHIPANSSLRPISPMEPAIHDVRPDLNRSWSGFCSYWQSSLVPFGCIATEGWACICLCASWVPISAPGLAPWACCAAVGCPCICRCASCDEAATSPLARFMVLVGGCSLLSLPVPTVWLVLCDAGPDPASFAFAVRPVSHGPANAVPALNTTTEQPARRNRLMFICASLFLPEALACQD
jgi:hypothetical protein